MSVESEEARPASIRPAQNATLSVAEELISKSEDDYDNDYRSGPDSNEASEDTHRPTVVEPEKDITSPAAPRSEALADTGSGDSADYEGDEIERRLFVGGSKISDELKRLREQRAKRLTSKRHKQRQRKRNRKRRGQISNKNLVKMTQTRQSSSSTTQTYDATAAAAATDASVIAVNPTNPLTTGLRQHLSNPLNLTSAVQRLIMSKLTSSANDNQQRNQQQQQQQQQQKQPRGQSSTSIVMSPMPNVEFLQPAEEFRSETLAKKYPATQHPELFADGFGHAQGSSEFGVVPSSMADSTFAGRLPSSNNRQVVPIEIIGLDPAVTNSIIYGSGGGNAELQLLANGHGAASPGGEASDQQSGASDMTNQQHQQSTRGLRNTNTVDSGLRMKMNQPSILHIHHFHPLAANIKPMSAGTVTGDGASGGEPELAEQQQQAPEGSQQQDQTTDQGEQSGELGPSSQIGQTTGGSDPRIQSQQLFVNEKGELVYLAVQDKTPNSGGNQDGSATDEQQPTSLAEPQGQEITGSTGEAQQLGAESATMEQPPEEQQHHVPPGYQQQIFVMQNPDSRTIVPIPMHASENQHNDNGDEGSAHRHHQQQQQQQQQQPQPQPQPQQGPQKDTRDKMIMVSYRPSNARLKQNNSTRHQSMRGAYNEGQESTLNPSENQPGQFQLNFSSPTSSQVLNSTADNLQLIDHLIKQINSSFIMQDTNNIQQNRPQAALYSTNLPMVLHHQQQQRPHHFSSFGPGGHLALHQQQELPSFHLQARPLMVDGGQPDGGSFHDGSQTTEPEWQHRKPFNTNHSHLDNFNTILSHSRVGGIGAAASDLTLLRNSSAVAASANLLTNSELMSLFQELKRPSNGSGQNRSLATAAAKVGGFELTQASDQSPPRYMKNQTTSAAINSHHRDPHKFGPRKEPSSSSQPQATVVGLEANQPNIAGSGIDLNDSSGISNLAMAFIFVISLVTLLLISASLIYRYRRRSMGRCSNLAGRSRLNLTQRTKHFVRSNFVNPNDVSSIKSINLSAGSSTLQTTGTESTVTSDKGGRGQPGAPKMNITDRYTTTKSYGAGGNRCLSTFNANSSSNRHLGASNEQSATDAADIKTLNTRLQKPSYLKSLISPRAPAETTPSESRKKRSSGAADMDSHYLNIKQRYATSDHKRATSTKHCVEGSQNYGLAGLNKQQASGDSGLADRLVTINSLADADHGQVAQPHHTCNITSPSQHRRQTTSSNKLTGDSGKLTNLPLSRHVVAPNSNCKLAPDSNSHHHRL